MVNIRKENPCFHCENRHPACHVDCAPYLEWAGEVATFREDQRNARMAALKTYPKKAEKKILEKIFREKNSM